jgi:hypothetical protein
MHVGSVPESVKLTGDNGQPISGSNPLPTTGGGSGGGSAPLDPYALNDLDGTDPLYIGKVKTGSVWLVQNYSAASGTMRYANLSNNPLYASYASAWAARATLTYGLFQTLTGV